MQALSAVITTANTVLAELPWLGPMDYAAMQADLVYGSGGTTIKAFLQTTFDGIKWWDIACLAFTTASLLKAAAVNKNIAAAARAAAVDGTLADDTVFNGFFGMKFRIKVVSAGTYGGATTLTIHAECHKSARYGG